ncbi:replication protein [Treponema porcinum]|uniref:replication protein n=1 Tax=Treponema porcinum TaxID=261392 RepID=UPI003F096979
MTNTDTKKSVVENTTEQAGSQDRTRTWLFIAYPESVPEKWEQILTDYGVPWARSPLHDRDKNEDGSPKKTHWHVLLKFSNKKSFRQVSEITSALNATIPQKCMDIAGSIRYFIHKDNPDKAQYKPEDIVTWGGIDVQKFLMQSADFDDLIMKIEDYVFENNITEYSDLCNITRIKHNEFPEWHRCVSSHTIHFRALLASRRHKENGMQGVQNSVREIAEQALET